VPVVIANLSFRRITGMLVSVLLVTGCVTTRVEQFVIDSPLIAAGESVVLLSNRQDAVVETEDGFLDCVYGRLQGMKSSVRIISEDQFKDELFPWFESRLAPTRAEAVGILLEQPHIKTKADALGVRYLVWIHGESDATNKQGSMSCSFSPAGGGCFGMLSWDNNSSYEATIWDLRDSKSLGIISSQSTGTSVMPALIVPIPIIARTKGASCRGLGDQLVTVLSGGS